MEFIHIFKPPATRGGPILLLLHGTGGNEHDLVPLAETLLPAAGILSPRGRVLERGMPRFFRRLAEGVFDIDDLKLRTAELADFITASAAKHQFATGNVTAVGFSNGANIASAMLLGRPDLLVGAVLLAAMVPYAEPPSADLDGTLVIISNGDRDPMIAAGVTQQLAAQLRERGAEVVELPHPGGHQIYPAVLPEIRRIIADRTVPTRRSAE